ncbi:MAG: MFS transporter [Phenylobacterium sp.]|uniref:MFS transporter n=1 Tax=Phenylobacterium sp. TaxID=1871053 RepID=UPI0027195D1A|nr:MFS transporter [Phenylobacterium sp.]MDO8913457.1 MFS transporter [Phenylobacterium sp.]MDO9249865.1 MFS transporter [Phenylobacterium sp.]MDP3101828.1 MFS transporter [Phenylobacterium sp.]MDP3634739.1 MFS transporter [Phenylobacterium sp.]MDZ4053381.1 MFS transporter [Phenylobacterium sp.]
MTVTESGGELSSEAMAPGLTSMQRFRAILGGSAGNFVEWYDWFVYSSFALYFAKHFFPKGDETAQLLQAAAVFAVGFLARPIGAWFMGLYADRAGRKAALTVSVSMMCAGSFAIAIIPDYSMIGTAAPVALVLARLVQGLSLGGEYGASATYMSEMAGRKRRGFWSSFLFVTLILGQLTALGVLILLQNILSPEDLAQWGWRIPFAIGGVLAIVVFWIRTGLEESQSYLTAQAEGAERSRTMLLFVKFPKETATIFALTSAGSLAFYAYTTYMQKFLVNTSGFTKDMATAITAAALLVYMIAQPAFGALSDVVGRKATLLAAFLLGSIFTYPIFSRIAVTSDATMAFALMCALVLILSGYTAVNAVLKAELFPAHVRALGVALPYATANAIFGGTAEYVALWFKKEGMESGFYVYVASIMAIAFLVALTLRDTNKHSLIMED